VIPAGFVVGPIENIVEISNLIKTHKIELQTFNDKLKASEDKVNAKRDSHKSELLLLAEKLLSTEGQLETSGFRIQHLKPKKSEAESRILRKNTETGHKSLAIWYRG